MHLVRPWVLALDVLVATCVGWGASYWVTQAGGPSLGLPYSTLITLGIVVVVVFGLGLRVRAWRNGNRRHRLNPILAARTLLLAQASAYTGALLLGWHFGVLMDAFSGHLLTIMGVVWPAVALIVGSLVVMTTGLVVERFCRIPPEDTGAAGSQTDSDGDYAL